MATHLSYTAMTGKPVVEDCVLSQIVSGGNLTAFAGIGAFREHHLRVLVTMPRTPLYVIKMVAQEPGTHPERAIDYCCSAAMARVLIGICGNVSCFSLYNQQAFRDGMALHDYGKGSDRFRRREVVYEVLCERVLFGGEVLPAHVAKWCIDNGSIVQHVYMRKHGSDHMMACFDLYQKQAFECEEEVMTTVPYVFMLAYHRYTKFLPLKMFFRKVSKKKAALKEIVKGMTTTGYTTDEIECFVGKGELRSMVEMKEFVQAKKRMRRFSSAIKSQSIKQLVDTVSGIFRLGCCEKLILSFL